MTLRKRRFEMTRYIFIALLVLTTKITFAENGRSPAVLPIGELSIEEYRDGNAEKDPGFNFSNSNNFSIYFYGLIGLLGLIPFFWFWKYSSKNKSENLDNVYTLQVKNQEKDDDSNLPKAS